MSDAAEAIVSQFCLTMPKCFVYTDTSTHQGSKYKAASNYMTTNNYLTFPSCDLY